MARAIQSSRSQSGSSGQTTSSSPNTYRIAKRVATRNTRQSSRIANSTASNSSIKGQATSSENMAYTAQVVAGQNVSDEKPRAFDDQNGEDMDVDKTAKDVERDDAAAFYRSICPITDKDERPFRLMELPTEIRLEIYRACLTRPYSILLSRQAQQTKSEAAQTESDSSGDDAQRRARHRLSQSQRAAVHASSAPATVGVSSNGSQQPTHTTAQASNASTHNPTQFQVLLSVGGQPSSHFQPARSKSLAGHGMPRNQLEDPLLTNILRVSKEVYKEARGVLYSENYFTLDLSTAQSTLACLHQRSRRQIKHIELEIPSYNDILERFQETVRLSLRYCSGLKECLIHMPFMLPGADGSGTSGNTTVYANGFDILRWLPQECNIELKGATCVEIEQVVDKHRRLAKTLDKLAYARRQLISNETGPPQHG